MEFLDDCVSTCTFLISENMFMSCMRIFFGLLSLVCMSGMYALIIYHLYAFSEVICPLLKSRLGTEFGLTWLAVGLVILLNIVFNHFWAVMIKPGSTID